MLNPTLVLHESGSRRVSTQAKLTRPARVSESLCEYAHKSNSSRVSG